MFRHLLEMLDAIPDHAPSPPNQSTLLMYRREYDALDKKCREEHGMSLEEYMGDHWKIKIIEPMPTAGRYLWLLVLVVCMIVSGFPAMAQQICGSVGEIEEALSKVGEVAIGKAVANDGRLLMMFVNLDEGSFSVVKVNPEGVACVVDIGEDWQFFNYMGQPL